MAQVNVIITVFCCLDTANVAVPVFGVCILLPVLLQFTGGVLYMYIVSPLKMLVGTRKDKDENYNALFEERFNTRVKKKPKRVTGEGESAPRSRKGSTNNFIRRANSMDNGNKKYEQTHEIIEEEIDSDEEAELQQQFQKSLLSDLSKTGHNNHTNGSTGRRLDSVRHQLEADGTVNGVPRRPPSIGRVDKPNATSHAHKNRGKHSMV